MGASPYSDEPDRLQAVDQGRQARPSLEDPDNLRVFVARIKEGVYITSPDGRILDANPALLNIFAAPSLEALRGYRAHDLIVDPERRAEQRRILDEQGAVRDFELRVRRLDGEIRTVLDTTIARGLGSDPDPYYLGILIDITERKRMEERYQEMSRRDPLTGCHNRRYLEEMRATLHEASASWGCVLADIDRFKEFNDTSGHDHGDRMLVKVARFLYRHARADDAVVRLGGDEFVLLVCSIESENMDALADRLRRHAARELEVRLSFGTACRRPGETMHDVIARADHDMYAGRGMRDEQGAGR